jgi:hypothetical protein
MMKIKNCLAACALALPLFFAGATFASSSQFFTAVSDLPLMPGFIEQLDENMVFDKPEGRIIETEAVGKAERDGAERFYLETLPQLGWKFIGGSRFEREGEVLEIGFAEQEQGYISIHIIVKPKG